MEYMRLGSYLIRKGLLDKKQVRKILDMQNPAHGVHTIFGRIAFEKGFIEEDELRRAIMEKFREEIVEGNYLSLSA